LRYFDYGNITNTGEPSAVAVHRVKIRTVKGLHNGRAVLEAFLKRSLKL
jgi:hypothetical protein